MLSEEASGLAATRLAAHFRVGFSASWPSVVSAAIVLGLWELAVSLFTIPKYLLPPPSDILGYVLSHPGYLLDQSSATLMLVAVGFAASVVIGFPLGVLVAQSQMFSRMVYPLLVASQTFPKLAVAPLFIVWFGFGSAPKILVTFLVAFFPVVLSVIVGLQTVQEETIELTRSIGLGPVKTLLTVRLPQALPSIFGGLKLSITLAVVGAIVGEFLGASRGLGYLIVLASGTLDTVLLFSSLFVLMLLGLGLYGAVGLVEQVVIPWHHEAAARLRGR